MFSHTLTSSDLIRHAARHAWGRAALLALLAFPLACDRDATGPEAGLPVRPEASIFTPVLPSLLPPDFDASQYFGLNVALAARQQYGSAATVVTVSNHLYGWRAVVGGRRYSIDMQRAVRDQFGSGHILGAVGVGIYDWRAVRTQGWVNRVLPVMPIASDYFYNVDAVRTGLANLRSVLITTRNWYGWRVGKTFRMLQPLVVFNQSSRTAAQWNALAASTAAPGHTFDFWTAAVTEFFNQYPTYLPGGSAMVIVPFTGASPDVTFGANGASGAPDHPKTVGAPQAASITCPSTGPLDARCAEATYWIGHSLPFTFLDGEGINYSCVAYPGDPNCSQSILQDGRPWDAILLPGEITKLQASLFFN
jgi:hypothetical protein